MQAIHASAALLLILTGLATAGAPAQLVAQKSEWKALFNGKDLSGWEKSLAVPDAKLENPKLDEKNVFTVTNVDGAGAIHVSGEVYGAITSREEFENFHLRLQFKWGEKRWPARANVARDSGILYCSVGQPNPSTGWMTSVENNVMEKGVGQWWSVNGAIIDVEGEIIRPEMELFIPYKKEGAGEQNIVYRKGKPLITADPGNGITPEIDMEYVFGNWNTVEVIFWGGNCIHILNGKVNLVAVNPRYQQGNEWRALDQGKIQLQSEAAEVFYRNIEARPLYELPAEFMTIVPSPVAGEEGFVDLFSEAELKKWKQCGPGHFKSENGVTTGEGGMGLWWYSGKQFTNFVLRGEFIQEQDAADSGVFLRFPDPGEDPWNAVKQGHEVEIGDDKAENPTWHTGSIYPFQAAITAAAKPAGNWNRYEIVCRGPNYSARLNETLVTTWTDFTHRTSAGFIGLQNYNDGKTVRHRNLRVKEIRY
jgi:hypothetical protein